MVVAETVNTDVSNFPISLGGVTKGANANSGLDVRSFQVLYSGWDAAAPLIPEDYWTIPPTCFQKSNGGGSDWRVEQQQQQQQEQDHRRSRLGAKRHKQCSVSGFLAAKFPLYDYNLFRDCSDVLLCTSTIDRCITGLQHKNFDCSDLVIIQSFTRATPPPPSHSPSTTVPSPPAPAQSLIA